MGNYPTNQSPTEEDIDPVTGQARIITKDPRQSSNSLGFVGSIGAGVGSIANWANSIGTNFMAGYNSMMTPALNTSATGNTVTPGTSGTPAGTTKVAEGAGEAVKNVTGEGGGGAGAGNGAQTAAAWGQAAVQALTSYLNYRNGKKQLALEREKFLENKAASHANFKNQAMALNTQYRDQMSGRGYVGMSSGAKRDLGKQYENRKVATDY